MARHKKQDQTEGENVATQATALEQGHAADVAAQNSNERGEAQIAESGRIAREAEEAASAYAQREIDRSNEVARMQDERAAESGDKRKESKSERFVRLANKRVTKALTVLGHIHNLTNSSSYTYTPEQAQRVIDALVLAVNRIVDGFSGQKNGKQSFTL